MLDLILSAAITLCAAAMALLTFGEALFQDGGEW
jgi:hypothetical protein